MTLTHAQYYKFLNIQKLNYMNICTGGKIFKSNHDVVMIDGGREQVFFKMLSPSVKLRYLFELLIQMYFAFVGYFLEKYLKT